jgi:hypothetical protein
MIAPSLFNPTFGDAILDTKKPVESDVSSGLLELALLAGFLALYSRIKAPQVFPATVDTYLSTPAIFSLVVIAQGLLGGLGLPQVPKRLEKLQKNPIARFSFMTAIAYTATSDLEIAIFSTAAFAVIMHMFRTAEERKEVPYLV